MPEQITLYGRNDSPYNHRVAIALAEVGAKCTMYTLPHSDKPAWYAEKVNPAGTVPCITYGGPATDPASPSPESRKIPESLVISELLADLYPGTTLVPTDPLKKADMRLFIAFWDQKGMDHVRGFLTGTSTVEAYLTFFEELQARLPPTGFAIGEFSLADVAIAPFLLLSEMALKNEIGKYAVEDGKKVLGALAEPKFSRIQKYVNDLKERPSIKNTYDEAACYEAWAKLPYMQRG
ncbi:thioredoxin-like protein [Epithele typhae]|uniref:thioredoxin-like protein n=1 Tax=Epithele typhae TaxID=378194 RepID=UPI002007C7F0|nr:thioredoxin-like protein [Epithele typhae]KAH9923130.1 thioredoxin-like protein [Epithele typhae]